MQKNPFDLPSMGFNQENPLFTSMNMMRQMWESMGASPMNPSAPTSAMPSAEDLNKRIKELRTVENWLRLNLSMLTNTIQGLEIQHSTLSTLQSFAQSGLASMPGLAEALTTATMQPKGQSSPSNQSEASSSSKKTDNSAEAEPTTLEQAQADETQDRTAEDNAEYLLQAGQAWWNLMQEQFDALAQATTQSMQQAQSTGSALSSTIGNPSADTTFGKSAATKKTAKKAAKTTAKTASKTAPSSTKTAKKATKASKKSAGKTATVTKAAKKTSSAENN